MVYLQNSVCVLPDRPEQRKALEELRGDIEEKRGEAQLMPIRLADAADEARMKDLFRRQSEEEYAEVLGKCRDFHEELRRERAAKHFTFAELEENEEELSKIAAWRAKILKRDFFGAASARKTSDAIDSCQRDLDRYRLEVADADGVGKRPASAARKTRRKKS